MTTKTKKLIELAERAKVVEGADKWGMYFVYFYADYAMMSAQELKDRGKRLVDYIGPLLPHNPLDPVNPAACLRRAGVVVVHWSYTEQYGAFKQLVSLALNTNSAPTIKHNWPALPDYADYMEALLNLHDLAKSEGGEWAEAWDRAMTPEGE